MSATPGGWICPGCGQGYAPTVLACWHCRPRVWNDVSATYARCLNCGQFIWAGTNHRCVVSGFPVATAGGSVAAHGQEILTFLVGQ